jgi:hypothetical protein
MAHSKKSWSDLTTGQRRAAVIAGAVEAVLTAAALRDLARRTPDQVRGPKLIWRLACAVQPVGPVAYFLVGRRPTR